VFFFTTDVSVPIGRPITYSLLGEFPGLGLALVPNVVVLHDYVKVINRLFTNDKSIMLFCAYQATTNAPPSNPLE